MCNRCLSGRPSREVVLDSVKTIDTLIHHDRKKYSDEEWEEICKTRLQCSQQDPYERMGYEVFV